MSYLAENIKVLLWKNKGELSNKTYEEYIGHVACQCSMKPDRLCAILRDESEATSLEAARLTDFFQDYGYDLSAIQYMRLFDELIDRSEEILLAKNLQYLLQSLSRGKNAAFVEAIGVNPSTLSRWKNGSTRPDPDSQRKICAYFGYSDIRVLKRSFLFLGLEPISSEQRKQQCKDLIDHMDKDLFEKLYPALVKLLN